MKLRTRRRPILNKRKGSVGRRAPNPLRIDPTRSAGLRRAFQNDLKRRFARLRSAIVKLVVEEDAFGLAADARGPQTPGDLFAANVFCPTGAGGGVDPTCSPDESGGAAGGDDDGGKSEADSYAEGFTDGKGTAADFTDANYELERDENEYRVVPNPDGTAKVMHIDDVVDEYGEDWTVETNPLTGKAEALSFEYYRELEGLEGDDLSKVYVHGFNDPAQGYADESGKVPQEVVDEVNDELEEYGSGYRIEHSKDHEAWIAKPITITDNYDPDQPRDDLGRFGATSSASVRGAGDGPQADTYAKGISKSNILQKLGAPGKWMKDQTAKLYGKLEARYGRTQAIAIMASGQVLAWGATAAGAAMGVPVWLPGSSLWGAVPAAAIAEVYLQAKRGVGKLASNEEGLSQEELKQLAAELLRDVEALVEEGRRQFGDVVVTDNIFCPTGPGGGNRPDLWPGRIGWGGWRECVQGHPRRGP